MEDLKKRMTSLRAGKKPSQDCDIKLTYFGARGRAEISRLILTQGGVEFDDIRLNGEEFGQVKPLLPYGSVPILEFKGEVICESMAIAKLLAEECGLAGKNNLEGAQACEIALALNGILDAIYGVMFAKEAERPAILKKLLGETLPLKLGQLETRLTQRGGQFFAGNTVTWADLMLVMVSDNLKSPVLGAAAVLNKFPRLCNLIERINNLPNIKAFKAARPIDPMFKN